ncbi:MAG: hypothetical protein J0I77_06190 [Rudaea sp.]|uniref:hypothetical protein n=1 Tax=unclassified Rudaea TaxID=2627037 RepID=UPI0010F80061|nr:MULTISPECIES: hypothetical protein [unclassified Rudaea]MBN8885290.1 hypothetical protein [Rudaea sp.]MBR0346645.1 hypothetical protein [Rudaea sp.]
MRILVWLAILALALLGRWEHSDAITAAIVPVALLFLVFMSPRALRGAIAAIAAAEAIAWLFGGIGLMIDILPAAIAAFVGWLFARSLVPPRTPLIARAIAAIDGPAHLRDPAVVRYAERLTRLWVWLQFALAALCLLCVAAETWGPSWFVLPSARTFGMTVLPLAVAALFFGEFFLRSRLLPQAPRHTLPAFLAALARVWSDLIEN